MINKIATQYINATQIIDKVSPIFDLGIRLWIAKIFLQSGLTKIQSWDTTLMLFEYEYNVPVISPAIAAYMATAAELILPVLLILGLLSRPAALALFILNAVAVISYADISIAGVKDHYLWGFMLAVTFFYGAGKLSIDNWLCKRFH